jgi:hypothetical protein
MMNMDAVFAYHRQLNALNRIGRGPGESPLRLDELRRRTRGQQPTR